MLFVEHACEGREPASPRDRVKTKSTRSHARGGDRERRVAFASTRPRRRVGSWWRGDAMPRPRKEGPRSPRPLDQPESPRRAQQKTPANAGAFIKWSERDTNRTLGPCSACYSPGSSVACKGRWMTEGSGGPPRVQILSPRFNRLDGLGNCRGRLHVCLVQIRSRHANGLFEIHGVPWGAASRVSG